MYDRPENRAAHDALWRGVRQALGYGPIGLNRMLTPDQSWADPDLVLGQICNLPYRATFKDQVTRLACPDYGLPDTPPGYYHSVLVTRREDAARGLAPALLGRFAYNDPMSQSGWGAPKAMVAARGLSFHTTVRTGSHLESARAVAEGRADLASIDAVTWRMLCQWESFAAGLAVIDRTALSPGMTFITARGNDPAPILAALTRGIDELAPEHQDTLGLRGLKVLPDAAYNLPLAAPPQQVIA